MSRKGQKGGRALAQQAEIKGTTQSSSVSLSPAQQLIKDVLVGAGDSLPKDSGWPLKPDVLTKAISELEAVILKALAQLPQSSKEPDYLHKLVILMTMSLQQNAGLSAPNAKSLVAISFTFIWDELTKYPSEYGITAVGTKIEKAVEPVEEKDPEREKDINEHYRPPAANDLEAWSKAFNFTKASIKPSTA